MSTFKLDDEFKARNRKHSLQERINLEELIKAEGCIENALTVAIIDGDHVLCDGYTTHEICEQNGIQPTKPRYINLPNREAVLAWIDKRQRGRRNFTAEEMADNRSKRIERVVEARADGQSTRAIAEKEGVSQRTIIKDIETAAESPDSVGQESTESGDSAEPKNGHVTGKDGKKHPAKATKLCDNCKHRKEMGRPVVDKCHDCKEARKRTGKGSHPKKKSEPKGDAAEPTAEEIEAAEKNVSKAASAQRDHIGNEVPKNLRDIFGSNVIADAIAQVKSIHKVIRASQTTFPYLHDKVLFDLCESLVTKLDYGQAWVVCKDCKGKGCKCCRTCGYLSRGLFEEQKHYGEAS